MSAWWHRYHGENVVEDVGGFLLFSALLLIVAPVALLVAFTWRIIMWFVKHWRAILAVLAVVVAGFFMNEARADARLIWKTPDMVVVLHDTACVVPVVVERIDPDWLPQWKRAVVTFQGKQYEACYAGTVDQMGQPMILIVDEELDAGVVPLERFEPVTEI